MRSSEKYTLNPHRNHRFRMPFLAGSKSWLFSHMRERIQRGDKRFVRDGRQAGPWRCDPASQPE
jgi:hypothetical protein